MKQTGPPRIRTLENDDRESYEGHDGIGPYLFIVVLGAVLLIMIYA
jgi:hypothetical protein